MQNKVSHLDATVCYLKRDNYVLMINFSKKWGQDNDCNVIEYEIRNI